MLNIREAKSEDIPQIVDIHLAAFPNFFLSTLGKRFLKLYYSSVNNHRDGILLVGEQNGHIVGLCAGTVLSVGFNSRLIKSNFLGYCIEAILLLITRPQSILHIVKNMSKEDNHMGDDGNYAELLSIGVDPNVQRSGTGRAMLENLEKKMIKMGTTRISLTTDYYHNKKAIDFYESLGYKPWYDFVTYPNRKMYRLIKQL